MYSLHYENHITVSGVHILRSKARPGKASFPWWWPFTCQSNPNAIGHSHSLFSLLNYIWHYMRTLKWACHRKNGPGNFGPAGPKLPRARARDSDRDRVRARARARTKFPGAGPLLPQKNWSGRTKSPTGPKFPWQAHIETPGASDTNEKYMYI